MPIEVVLIKKASAFSLEKDENTVIGIDQSLKI